MSLENSEGMDRKSPKWKIIYLESVHSARVLEWNDSQEGARTLKSVSLYNIREENPHLLIYPAELPLQELESFFQEESSHYSIVPADKIPLTFEEFENLAPSQVQTLLKNFYGKWILGNNLQTIEEIFRLSAHLKELWKKDYNSFFEELWFVFKRNLGALELRMIFHDVLEGKEGEAGKSKEKLGYAYIEGERHPRQLQGGELEKRLLGLYPPSQHRVLQFMEYSEESGEIVISGHMRHGPILFMGKVFTINKLQKSILTSLFEGLQT